MINTMCSAKSSARLAAAVLLILSTVAKPIWAQDDTATSRVAVEDDGGPARLSDLGTHINPQLGVSSFEYSGVRGGSKQKLSGGATVEFGEGMRRLETGLLFVQSGGRAELEDGSKVVVSSSYIALPMLAKIRVAQLKSQSWFLKTGFLTAFEASSSNNSLTNNIDVLGSLGASGRFVFTKQSDFIVEATYNRGFMEAVRSSSSRSDYNQGILVMAGVSFKL